jgi:hypothetical protein
MMFLDCLKLGLNKTELYLKMITTLETISKYNPIDMIEMGEEHFYY